MNGRLLVLPRVWACAAEQRTASGMLRTEELRTAVGFGSVARVERPAPGPVASAAGAVLDWRADRAKEEPFQPGRRKGPHALLLVQAVAALAEQAEGPTPGPVPAPNRQVSLGHEFYRKYTEAMLRRYTKLSMEAGRVPSLLGQEMFRGRVTSYKVHGFDDVVIFVHDVGQCLEQLSPAQRHLLRRIACEQYTQGETAAMLGISLRTVIRRYGEALDRLTAILLQRRMLEPLTECRA